MEINKDAKPYYPLPSNEGYEKFLKEIKKEKYAKCQYSMPFMLSLKDKFTEMPYNMNPVTIPQKSEIRSRAKVVTEEAYRVTRNYIDEKVDNETFSINYIAEHNQLSEDKVKSITKSLREILNKISHENYDDSVNQILKFEYDEKLLEILRDLLYCKILTESKYFYLYVNICSQMCKLYNKKTYANEPKMHLKSLLLSAIQKEFNKTDETNLKYPFKLSEEEKINFAHKVKRMNVKLIAEFYLSGLIITKIIEDCINILITTKKNICIVLLYDLIKIIYKKLASDNKEILEKAFSYFKNLNEDKEKIEPKIKCLILEMLELSDTVKNQLSSTKYEEISTPYSQLGAYPIISSVRKSSGTRSRKSSINPKDVEYVRRSRFNSIADELKVTKVDSQHLMDELVNCLGSDLEFYQCFRLTEEEFDIIKEGVKIFLSKFDKPYDQLNKEELNEDFKSMMEEVQCEKFIAIGHMLEIMFSLNKENAERIMRSIIAFFKWGIIGEEEIKHGIVLGLVNFKQNIIDYPNSKEYFQSFINLIKENDIMNENILKVYQRTCDNLVKCYE
ncbi:MAG: MIF4G domain-containing protein [archaeon]|nr:MIF4G domain-containing protein [archaeon]